MKIRVTLLNETAEVVSSKLSITHGIDLGALTLYDAEGYWLATFGPGCWLSAVKVVDEN